MKLPYCVSFISNHLFLIPSSPDGKMQILFFLFLMHSAIYLILGFSVSLQLRKILLPYLVIGGMIRMNCGHGLMFTVFLHALSFFREFCCCITKISETQILGVIVKKYIGDVSMSALRRSARPAASTSMAFQFRIDINELLFFRN